MGRTWTKLAHITGAYPGFFGMRQQVVLVVQQHGMLVQRTLNTLLKLVFYRVEYKHNGQLSEARSSYIDHV